MDTDGVLTLMVEVAEELVTPRFRALAAGEIDQKSPGDYVTVADREAEQALTRRLLAAFPDAVVVGEETVYDDPDSLRVLATHPHVLVVDPVDGTGNFVRGNPDHAVIVAEVRDQVVTRGWIHQPAHGVSYVAERGAGVRRDGNLLPTPVAPRPPVGWAWKKALAGLESPLLGAPVGRTRFCCGVDYPLLLDGATGFVVYAPPNPWDHLAGTLMLREVGGVARTLDGAEYGPRSRGPGGGGACLLVALDDDTWQTAAAVLGPHLPT